MQISVQDTGTGIDEQNIPRIFEPFFTTWRASKRKPGTSRFERSSCRVTPVPSSTTQASATRGGRFAQAVSATGRSGQSPGVRRRGQ
ncbi:MAG: ATP-binding protein [Acidobacteriota bacterium]